MGNCFCTNEMSQQLIIKNEVSIPNSDSNFTTSKFENDKPDKQNSRIKTFIRLKSNRKNSEVIAPSSMVSTEIFIRYKSKKSSAYFTDTYGAFCKNEVHKNPSDKKVGGKRETLLKELTDRNSTPQKDMKFLSCQSSVIDNKLSNEGYIDIKTKGEEEEQKNSMEIPKETTVDKDNSNTNKEECNSSELKQEEKMNIEETKIVNQVFTKEDEKQLLLIFLSHFMFRHFSRNVIRKVIDALTGVQIESGLFLFNKGEEATAFYIIKSGLVRIIDEENFKLLKNYSTFGEIALTKNEQKRKYSAKAESSLEVYILDKNDYLELQQFDKEEKYRESFKYLFDSFYLFNFISDEEKVSLIQLGYVDEYPEAQTQVQWNPNSSNKKCLFISQGKVKITNKLNNNVNESLNHGTFYGMSNLFFQSLAIQNSYLTTTLDNTEIIFIYEKMLIEVFGLNYQLYLSLKCFTEIIHKDFFLSKIVKNCKIPLQLYPKMFLLKHFSKGEIIFPKGLYSNRKAYIILTGAISGSKNNITTIAKKGMFFRTDLLISSYDFEDDIVASKNLFVFETGFQHLINILSKNKINIAYLNLVYSLTNIFPFFSQAKLEEIINISNHVKSKTYYKSEIIVQKNKYLNSFYLIAKGTVKLTNGKDNHKMKIIEQGNVFGDFCILMKHPSPYNYVAKSSQVILYILTEEFFLELLHDNTRNDFILRKMFLEENNISLSDLYYLSYLGRGRFGNVCLVHNEVCFYAIKAISKSFAEKQKFGVKYLLYEKETLCSLDHPFILKLVKTLKNENWLFFLMEHIKGMNMNEYLDTRKVKKNIFETKFYAGCLFVAINYLHQKKIIHRDIKPSNLMIDNNGYIKVIDFGTAIKLKKEGKTKTVIGTPNFIAPEVLRGGGYSFSCDYWSIGVCIYYIFYGTLPFGNNSIEILDTYKEILEKEVEFPDKNNNEINSLICSLLEKNEAKRNTDFNNIKTHLLFSDFHWEELIQFKIKPPFIPGKDARHNTENLQNKNLPFVMFMENEKCDTKQTVTLKFNSPTKKNVNTKKNYLGNIPENWFENF